MRGFSLRKSSMKRSGRFSSPGPCMNHLPTRPIVQAPTGHRKQSCLPKLKRRWQVWQLLSRRLQRRSAQEMILVHSSRGLEKPIPSRGRMTNPHCLKLVRRRFRKQRSLALLKIAGMFKCPRCTFSTTQPGPLATLTHESPQVVCQQW